MNPVGLGKLLLGVLIIIAPVEKVLSSDIEYSITKGVQLTVKGEGTFERQRSGQEGRLKKGCELKRNEHETTSSQGSSIPYIRGAKKSDFNREVNLDRYRTPPEPGIDLPPRTKKPK